jgi:hypothetical protein
LDLSYVAVEAAFENISNTFDHDVIVFLKPFDFSFGTKNVIIVGAVAAGALAPFVVDSCITDLIKVVISEQDNLLDSPYVDRLLIADKLHPSLNYGDTISQPGFHIMATPTRDWGEILTGLGATGVGIIVSAVHDQSLSGHPMIPVLQVTDNNLLPQHLRGEIDVFLSNVHLEASRQLLESIVRTASHDYTPKLTLSGNVNFQITRGLLGVSL